MPTAEVPSTVSKVMRTSNFNANLPESLSTQFDPNTFNKTGSVTRGVRGIDGDYEVTDLNRIKRQRDPFRGRVLHVMEIPVTRNQNDEPIHTTIVMSPGKEHQAIELRNGFTNEIIQYEVNGADMVRDVRTNDTGEVRERVRFGYDGKVDTIFLQPTLPDIAFVDLESHYLTNKQLPLSNIHQQINLFRDVAQIINDPQKNLPPEQVIATTNFLK